MARYTKKKSEHPMLKFWLKQIGAEISRRRKAAGKKQDSFKTDLGVSRDALSAIENGSRSYGVEALLIALAGVSKDPVEALMKMEFPAKAAAHTETHVHLQEILNAGGELGRTTQHNVELAYQAFLAEKKASK